MSVIPAATVILVRESERGLEVFLVKRHKKSSFMSNAFVFPGGKIDPTDADAETAAARELFEEAGVRATQVRYLASQPWPFPSSQLMLACVATVASDELSIDRDELEDAMWVDRAGVESALASAQDAPFLAPPPYAIASELLRRWANGE